MATDAQPVKVLLDTDIGSDIDDALALAYLLSEPRCELLGVTTVTGEPAKRAEMAACMCEHVGRTDVPVHVGSSEGILVEMRQKTAPQAEALADRRRRRDFGDIDAVDFLRRTIRAHPGEVTLLAIGPLTNVGLLLATDPQIASQLKQLVLMCGRFFIAPGGEWNAVGDPHATAIVYGGGSQSRPPRHVSFGLDVTTQCRMDADACRKRFTAKVLEPVRDFAEVWFRSREHITFHDPLAAACIFRPDLCEYRQGTVAVSLAPPTLGWTVFGNAGTPPPHTVASAVDAEAFFEHYFRTLEAIS